MPSRKHAPFVALAALLQRRYPDVDNATLHISRGHVLVDGRVISNPRALVRADSSVRVREARPLRGAVKLGHAIRELSLDLEGRVAVDIGAAAGGFTQALLDARVARVYAVDAGFGQLRGHLQVDSRVVSLERTNLGILDDVIVPEVVDIVTVDLSYLSLAGAARQLDRLRLDPDAKLLALVKPTFELRSAALAASERELSVAIQTARQALGEEGWWTASRVASPIRGASGALEEFIYALRQT
jgi:23S rRNA (cytidine1920-2'-O)/16S rRNA (cytidine1409-2'-O)-methyltransferase